MTCLLVRKAVLTDVEAIVDMNCRLAQETENLVLDPVVVRAGAEQALMLSEEVSYFVAEMQQQLVGQLMLTREWSDWRNGWIAWLQSVYVRREFRQQGVFRSLLNVARTDLSRRTDCRLLRLYVEDNNSDAMQTYARLGFRDANYRVLECRLFPPPESKGE
ncbi:MAG: GNAT family N-acetyltransferase [Planctomycetaceae bacterium]|nr:GNAT family N-acetyltransferase [Planctomycetaceae bacterium]